MRDLIFGNHIGIVVNTADPDQRNRIQVWVPHLSTTVYDKLNKEGKDLTINQGSLKDINEIKERLIAHLPWAESAVPVFGGNGSTFTNPESLQTTSTHRPVANENTNNAFNQVKTQGRLDAQNENKDVSSSGTSPRGNHNDPNATASDFPEFYKYAYEGETVGEYKLRLFGTAIMAAESGTDGVLDKASSRPDGKGDYGYFQMNKSDKENFLKRSKMSEEQKQFVVNNLWANNTNVSASDAMRAWTMYVKDHSTYGASGGFVETIKNTPIETFSDSEKMTAISRSKLNSPIDGSALWSTLGSRQLDKASQDQTTRVVNVLAQKEYMAKKEESVRKMMEKTSPNSGSGTINVAGTASPHILEEVDRTIYQAPKSTDNISEPGGMLSTPLPGTMVWVFFHGGDVNRPVYFAGVAEPNQTGRTGNRAVAVTPDGPKNTLSLNSQEPIKLDIAGLGTVLLTDAKGNPVKDVNGNNIYVDQAAISDLAFTAENYTTNCSSGGLCYRGVKTILDKAGVVSGYLEGGMAWQAESALLKENSNPNAPYGWVKLSTATRPEEAPPGSVIVYNNGNEAGHIEVKSTNGKYVSDFQKSTPSTYPVRAILVPTPKNTS